MRQQPETARYRVDDVCGRFRRLFASHEYPGGARQQTSLAVQYLLKWATEIFDKWELNGSAEARYHGNLNIRPRGPNGGGLDVGRLMSECRNVMFSAGSACASGSGRTSHVLEAIGLPKKLAKASIRLGFGRYTTLEEIEEAGRIINEAAQAQGSL